MPEYGDACAFLYVISKKFASLSLAPVPENVFDVFCYLLFAGCLFLFQTDKRRMSDKSCE